MLFGSLPVVRAFANKYKTGKQRYKKREAGRTTAHSGSVLTSRGTIPGDEGKNESREKLKNETPTR